MTDIKEIVHYELTRRNIIVGGAATLLGLTLGGVAKAAASDVDAMVSALAGGQTPKSGRISMDLPQIAENGNTVPLSISVESPMSEANYVKSLTIFADGNPTPEVGSFHFTPMSGKADVSTRMRMAKTQNIVAVAQMSDGSVYMESVQVKVTIGGCGG